MEAETKTDKKAKGKRTPIYVVMAIVIVAVIGGIVYIVANNSAAQTVVVGDNISVYYTGSFTNGTVFDSNVGKQPFSFVVGPNSHVIEGFDQAVIGMSLNQTKNVTISPANAYGIVNSSLIVTISRAQFGNHTVYVGMPVTASNGASGVVTAENATNITANFNPPLAGKTLVFEIKVIGIKPKQ
ncbi:MAG: peptidylprolyl isomerase [Candidatus Marsarchaeota archaeon]|nr:peptidylprolyl isomerase [Candidatus Marsarchaeota archaeon]